MNLDLFESTYMLRKIFAISCFATLYIHGADSANLTRTNTTAPTKEHATCQHIQELNDIHWHATERMRFYQSDQGNTRLQYFYKKLQNLPQQDLHAQTGRVSSATKDFGDTPLHLAILHDNEPLAIALLACGADINARNKRGTTVHSFAREIGKGRVLYRHIATAQKYKASLTVQPEATAKPPLDTRPTPAAAVPATSVHKHIAQLLQQPLTLKSEKV